MRGFAISCSSSPSRLSAVSFSIAETTARQISSLLANGNLDRRVIISSSSGSCSLFFFLRSPLRRCRDRSISSSSRISASIPGINFNGTPAATCVPKRFNARCRSSGFLFTRSSKRAISRAKCSWLISLSLSAQFRSIRFIPAPVRSARRSLSRPCRRSARTCGWTRRRSLATCGRSAAPSCGCRHARGCALPRAAARRP